MTLKGQLQYGLRHLVRTTPPVARRLRWLCEHERDDPEQVRQMQEAFLRRTLEHAARRLPAYRHLEGRIPAHGLHEFLQSLPIVDRQTLVEAGEPFYPYAGRPKPWHSVGRTSGSTGTPLEVLRSYDSVLWEQAFWRQHWGWAGWRKGQTQAVLRGDLVVPLERERPPYWIDDHIGGQMLVSIRHLNRERIGQIVEALQRRNPRLLRAYPSGAHTLAVLAAEAGLHLHFDAVITSSETLLPDQRRVIEQTFSTRVFDHYGMAERVALGVSCSHGRLHVHPHYSLVELVDEDGAPARDDGYIVGTTFHNLTMPLVRYRTTDRARWGQGRCPCGCTYPFLENLSGRLGDTLFDHNGHPVSPTLVCFALMGVPHVAKTQVAQVGPDLIELRVVPKPGFGDAEREQLLWRFRALVSDQIRVEVRPCEQLGLQSSGKFKFVAQEFYESSSRVHALAAATTAGATPAGQGEAALGARHIA
jgi:phenylacetate-CoA ligase